MRHPHDNPRNLIRQPAWADGLADRLGFTDYSTTTPRALLARGLLLAATGFAVSHAAPRLLRRGRETIRKGVAANLPDAPRVLEDRVAAGLRHTLPRRYRGRPLPVALDPHRRPYYGDRRRIPAVTGTSWFRSYATGVAVRCGHRYTLGVTAVGPGDTMPDVAERLLAQVGRAGLPVRYALLDRAFDSVGVVTALTRRRYRFIIAVIRRGQGCGRSSAAPPAGGSPTRSGRGTTPPRPPWRWRWRWCRGRTEPAAGVRLLDRVPPRAGGGAGLPAAGRDRDE